MKEGARKSKVLQHLKISITCRMLISYLEEKRVFKASRVDWIACEDWLII